MSRWTETFHEYISGLRVWRVTVPTPSPMSVMSPSERPGGVRMPCGYGSDSVAFRVAPLSSDQGTAASVLKAAPVWPESVARARAARTCRHQLESRGCRRQHRPHQGAGL